MEIGIALTLGGLALSVLGVAMAAIGLKRARDGQRFLAEILEKIDKNNR